MYEKTGQKSRAFLGNGVKGARPDGGRVIDALFFSRITSSFFEAASVHCASDAVTMVGYVGCCVGSGTGEGGGVIVCKKQTLLPALLTAGKPGPPDRPTDGHHKAAIFLGGDFFFILLLPCAFQAAAIEPAEQQQ